VGPPTFLTDRQAPYQAPGEKERLPGVGSWQYVIAFDGLLGRYVFALSAVQGIRERTLP
jgi:hypothetical protein